MQSTQGPVLSLKPLAYHMALSQVYNPCNSLSYRRLNLGSSPWKGNLSPVPVPRWEEHMHPNTGSRDRAGAGGVCWREWGSQSPPELPPGSKVGESQWGGEQSQLMGQWPRCPKEGAKASFQSALTAP